MNILHEICNRKRAHIIKQKSLVSLDSLKDRINSIPEPIGFLKALKNHAPPAIIAEVKKASPSSGIIRADFDPVKIAQIYCSSGAACLSVLTDEPYFQGKDEYLTLIKNHVRFPVLRKDFIIDEYQIFESRALGADCILLIMAALDDDMAKKLYRLADILGMDILVEVHNEDEMDRALKLNPVMIGVNNRNLETMVVDIETSHRLIDRIPEGMLAVSESGISDAQAIHSLQRAGYGGFLIGESLMRQPDIGAALEALFKNS